MIKLLIQTGPRQFFFLRILQGEGEGPSRFAACVEPLESQDPWAALHGQAERFRSRNRGTGVRASQISYLLHGFLDLVLYPSVDSVHPSGILRMHLRFSKISLK